MHKFVMAATFAVAMALTAGTASALEGDAAKGEAVYKKCAACHSIEVGKNKVGPSLAGLIGRVPGSVADFKYSKGMVEFGAGKVWDEATLAAYLPDPKGAVKGTKMAFAGLKEEQDVADVIAYIKTLPAQ